MPACLNRVATSLFIALFLFTTSAALAQDSYENEEQGSTGTASDDDVGRGPSDPDPHPQVPGVEGIETGAHEQAGTGGEIRVCGSGRD